MRCGSCHREWRVIAEWLDRFDQALEACPDCGTDCRSDDRPDFCAEQDDPLHDDSTVREHYWYHSSTHANWPDKDFDPAARLTDVTKQRMQAMGSGSGAVERWAERQKTKALHVGTYEAAIENMFRRMNDEGGSANQFYLYRVQLSPDCTIEPGVHQEPTDFVGDAHLVDVCGPGINTLRYVNIHEDPSSISLAVELEAIHAVQMLSIPLPADAADSWVLDAIARLLDAASKHPQLPHEKLQRRGRLVPSVLVSEARTLEREIAADLPLALRERFCLGFDEAGFEADPSAFPTKLVGLARLVTDPQAVLNSFDSEPWREVWPRPAVLTEAELCERGGAVSH